MKTRFLRLRMSHGLSAFDASFQAIRLIALILVICQSSIQAQEGFVQTRAKPYIFGARHCTGCHDQPSKKTDHCQMTEWLTWNKMDKHRIAFDWFDDDKKTTPAGLRAQRIADNLGIASLHQAKQCLGCHSMNVPENTPTAYFENPLQRAREGVTCVACHGGSKEWVIEHVAAADPDWKNTRGPDRWQKYGLTHLKNPVNQARLCISCHVGDTDDQLGRRISHEMYAAGHPPLQGLEVASFIAEMPRHWLSSNETQDPLELKKTPTASAVELLAASGLILLRTELALIGDSMDPHKTSGINRDPEFSVFDCSACHHNIASPKSRWRQTRQSAGAPGRPRLPQWPRRLVRLSLILAAPDDWKATENQIHELIQKVDLELTKSPYGSDSKNQENAIRQAIALLDRIIQKLHDQWNQTGKMISGEFPKSFELFLDSLLTELPLDPFDFDSARQIAWALRISLFSLDKSRSDKVMTQMNEIDNLLGLSLRASQSDQNSPMIKTGEQISVTELLADRLRIANAYQPDKFRSLLEQIVKQIRE